jgi:hypothetical protein
MPPQPVLTPRSWAIGAAAAVFSLGFGMLAVASALGMGEPAQPGLFTFRAATVGDGMLLPLLAYSLVRSCEPVRHWSRVTRRAVALGATVGVIAGAVSQASWLANPHPKVNWTFPSAGTFNGVGWYHAAFLVIASGFFAGATIAAVARLRKARSGSSVRSIGVLGTLVPALGFVALLGEDNGADLIVVMAEVVALALVATGVLVGAVGGAGARWCALVTASAILPAISLSLLFLPGSTVNLTTVLPTVCAALAGAFGASVLKATNQVDRIAMPLCVAVCSAGPVHAFAGAPTTTLLGLAAGCVLGAVLVVLELVMLRSLLGHSSPTVRTVLLLPLAALPITAFSLTGRYFSQAPASVSPYAVIAGVLETALFLKVCARAVRILFDPVITAEESNVAGNELAKVKWSAYLAISAMYTGALIACVVSLIGATPAEKWMGGRSGGFGVLVVLAAIPAALFAFRLVAARMMGVIAPTVCLAWTVLMSFQLANGYGSFVQTALSVMAVVITGLFTFEGIAGNLGPLQDGKIDRKLFFTAASAAMAAGTTAAWVTGPAIWSRSTTSTIPFAIVAWAIGSAAIMFLPWIAARALPGARPTRTYTLGTPTAGVLQDGFIAVILMTSIVWVPNLFLAHIADSTSWWTAVLPFFALLSRAYIYVMMNNIGHAEREQIRVKTLAAQQARPVSPDEQRALTELARHIQRQNRIAFIALVPLGFTVLFSERTGFDKEGLRQLFTVALRP